MYLRKTTSCGMTWWIPSGQAFLQTRQFLHCFYVLPFELLRQGYVAVLVGQVSSVQDFESPLCKIEEASDIVVFDERLSDVINLPSEVFPVWVRQERDGLKPDFPGGNVNVVATWVSPDGVKFSLYENARTLPYGPPDYLFAAKGRDVLWKDREAFVLWLVRDGLAEDGYRLLTGSDAKAELFDVRGIDRCGAHGKMTSNVKYPSKRGENILDD